MGLVGDNNVRLLDARAMGVVRVGTPVGNANEWLKNGVFKLLEDK